MNTRDIILSIALLATGAAAHANPTLVLDWGGDYHTGTGTAVAGHRTGGNSPAGVDSGTTRTWAYNDTTPINPASNYNTSLASAVYYGASQFTYAVGPANFTTHRIDNNNDVNRINVSTPVNSGQAQEILGFFAWKKADFLAGGSTGTVEALGSLAINLAASGGSPNVQLRALVQQGGMWYVSNDSFTNSVGLKTFTLDSSDLWAAWPGATSSLIGAMPTSFTVAATALNDITAVGFAYAGVRTNTMSFQIDSIEGTLSVVPEPSTWALIAGLVAGVAAWRRRRS